VPLGALIEVPESFAGVSLTASAEMYRQMSTITNYSYSNYRFLLGVSKIWEF
jgi:hypothetical protein